MRKEVIDFINKDHSFPGMPELELYIKCLKILQNLNVDEKDYILCEFLAGSVYGSQPECVELLLKKDFDKLKERIKKNLNIGNKIKKSFE